MNISEQVQWVTEHPEQWKLYRNRRYLAKIQKANPAQVYNVPDQPGVVYNFFEDAYEKVGCDGYVVTGAAGEMWPIGAGALRKYDIAPEAITDEPQPVYTVELETVYAAIRIPKETQFTLEVDYGETAILHGNRPTLDHGEGDYILVAAKQADGTYLPDFSDSGRIVNGTIFDTLYQPI